MESRETLSNSKSQYREEQGREAQSMIRDKMTKAKSTQTKTNASLEDALEKAWDYVQRRLYCYELPPPVIVESEDLDTACICMESHEIRIWKKFLDHLNIRGVANETALKGLLLHEAGHFKLMPWDLRNHILLTYHVGTICPEGKNELSNYFMDVCLNLELLLDKREDSIRMIYQKLEKKSPIDAVLSHVYAFKTGMDFDVPKITKELKAKVEELCKIRFTNKRMAYQNAERFAQILKDLIEKKNSASNTSENNTGSSAPDYSFSRIDDFDLRAYDEKEVERALKDMAKKMKSPQNYKKLYEFVRNEQEKLDKSSAKTEQAKDEENDKEKQSKSKSSKSSSTEPGRSTRKNNPSQTNKLDKNSVIPASASKAFPLPGEKGVHKLGRGDPKDALIEFYNAKAENYEICVEKRDVLGGGESGKSEFKPWEVDEPVSNVDVFNSYGKYLPEISKAWKEQGGDGKKKVRGTPDLLVIIDSSYSMTDPSKELSYAALGGICAARQYIRNGSKVAVVNFSSDTKTSIFIEDLWKASKNILHYQGGGTSLDTTSMREVLSENNNSVDIMLISDGFIHNYNDVMSDLASRKNTNRITVLEIIDRFGFGGFSSENERFKHKKIKLYSIRDASDIPKIVVEDMDKNGIS